MNDAPQPRDPAAGTSVDRAGQAAAVSAPEPGAPNRAPEAAPRAEAPATPATLPNALERHVRTLIEASTRVDPATPDRPAALRTEIELSPGELGRVRITVRETVQGPHLQIAADRPETLELVRRHLEGLQRAIAADGVTLAGLDLAGGGAGRPTPQGLAGGAGAGGSQPGPDRAPDRDAAAEDAPATPAAPTSTRLDLRL